MRSRTNLQRQLVDIIDMGMQLRGVNQTWVANHAGITPKHLSQMLNGFSSGTLGTWHAVLRSLDIEVEMQVVAWEKRTDDHAE